MENQTLVYMAIFLGGAGAAIALFWLWRVLARRWREKKALSHRALIEDTLKHFYNCETRQETPLPQSVAGVLGTSVAAATDVLTEMQQHELISNVDNRWQLTESGRNYALQIIRAHRLWERYLAEKTGYPESEWHAQSDKWEHHLSPEETEALATRLGHPRYDPHGDPIPTADGTLSPPEHISLAVIPIGQAAKVVHLEDEPDAIYEQLTGKGIHLGTVLRVLERTADGARVWLPGGTIRLNSAQMANVSVLPIPENEVTVPEPTIPLSALKPGEQGRVVSISPACKGAERRRMMDLGIVPGTIIKAEMVSPSGDPTAYLIRGALIALRREQAALINVSRNLHPVKKETPTPAEVTA